MRLLYSHPETGIACYAQAMPLEQLQTALGPLTEESYMAHVLGVTVPPGVKEVIILADDWKPPETRVFRNAWKIDRNAGQIVVDMELARDIQRDRIRGERKPQLEALDIAAVRAMTGTKPGQRDAAFVEIEAAKQKLRDAPAHPALEAAATPDELAAITLADLTT